MAIAGVDLSVAATKDTASLAKAPLQQLHETRTRAIRRQTSATVSKMGDACDIIIKASVYARGIIGRRRTRANTSLLVDDDGHLVGPNRTYKKRIVRIQTHTHNTQHIYTQPRQPPRCKPICQSRTRRSAVREHAEHTRKHQLNLWNVQTHTTK
jgi:hypothetical protein